jgi:hypothetical protein
MMLAGLSDVEVASAAADRPPLLASGSWGVGDVAVLQAVTGLSPPHCTPPSHCGGGGQDDLPVPTRTVGNLEPQPMAGKAGGYRQEGWRGTRKAVGNEEGWPGTKERRGMRTGGEGKEGWRGMKYNFGLDAMDNPRNSISSDTDTYKLC